MSKNIKLQNKVIDYLQSQQGGNGSFISKTSISLDFTRSTNSDTIFLTSLILSCIRRFPQNRELEKIKKKTLRFLLFQKNDNWSFNYWKKGSKSTKTMPYPDDLDDTFCALSAIYQTDPKALDASALAKIVTLLTGVEEKEGGPYYTWIIPPNADKVWRDVDLAVNANVAYFLALQDIFLPNLRKFIYTKIKQKDLTSKYYPSIFPVAYFLSRYLGLDREAPLMIKNNLREIILRLKKDDGWGNPLNTALAVSSLLRLRVEPETITESIKYLKQEVVHSNRHRQAYAFCHDPVINKRQYFAGSSALTAAFCLEAINQFRIQNAKFKITPNSKALLATGQTTQKIYNTVINMAKQRFRLGGTDIKHVAIPLLKRIIKSDKDKQIILFPYYFFNSLDTQSQKELKTNNYELITNLGLANLYGWIAYRIYDDFSDSEGNPAQLSVANLCLRGLTTIYRGILPEEFGKTMDILDNANTWEMVHTRFLSKNGFPDAAPDYGDYSQLADKSLGHALGPLAILIKLGFGADSKEVKQFLSFFRHYIIARQLNDDAHDWEEDLARGQINAVAAAVLTKTKDTSKLKEVFWQEAIEEVCQTILKHIQKAKSDLNKCDYIANKSLLSSLLVPIEKSATKALIEQKETLELMREYGK